METAGTNVKLLTTKEMAERLRVSEQTMRRWRKAGQSPPYLRLGAGKYARVRYVVEHVE